MGYHQLRIYINGVERFIMVNEIAIQEATMAQDTNGVFILGMMFCLILITIWVAERGKL